MVPPFMMTLLTVRVAAGLFLIVSVWVKLVSNLKPATVSPDDCMSASGDAALNTAVSLTLGTTPPCQFAAVVQRPSPAAPVQILSTGTTRSSNPSTRGTNGARQPGAAGLP